MTSSLATKPRSNAIRRDQTKADLSAARDCENRLWFSPGDADAGFPQGVVQYLGTTASS
jgi:hypothetical protein